MSSAPPAPRRAGMASLAPNAPPPAPSAAAKAVAAVGARAAAPPAAPSAASAAPPPSAAPSAAAPLAESSGVLSGAQLLKLPFSKAGAPDARAFRVFRAASAPADAIFHDGDGRTDFGAGELYVGYRNAAGAGARARVGGLLGKLAELAGAGGHAAGDGGGGGGAGGSGDRWSLHPLSCAAWVRQGDAAPVFARCRAKGLLARGRGLPPVEPEVRAP